MVRQRLSKWAVYSVAVVIVGCCMALPDALGAQATGADEFRQRGKQAFQDGQYKEAELWLGRALAHLASTGGSAELIAQTLGDLSATLTSQERFGEAEQLLNRAIAITKGLAADRRRQLPMLLGNLGAVHELKGELEKAEADFKEALRAAAKYLEQGNPYIAVLHSNLGAAYSHAGQDKAASKEIRKALELAEKHFGKDSPQLQPMLVNSATLHEKSRQWAAAESLLLRALEIAERASGVDHPDVSFVLEHLAVVHFRLDQPQRAEAELRRALEIERRTGRAEGLRIASVSFHLARVLAAQRKYDESRTLFGDALARQERTFGAAAPEVATTLEAYAKLLHDVNNDVLARQMEFRARQIRAEQAYTVRVR